MRPKVPTASWFLPWTSLATMPPSVTNFVPGTTRREPAGRDHDPQQPVERQARLGARHAGVAVKRHDPVEPVGDQQPAVFVPGRRRRRSGPCRSRAAGYRLAAPPAGPRRGMPGCMTTCGARRSRPRRTSQACGRRPDATRMAAVLFRYATDIQYRIFQTRRTTKPASKVNRMRRVCLTLSAFAR